VSEERKGGEGREGEEGGGRGEGGEGERGGGRGEEAEGRERGGGEWGGRWGGMEKDLRVSSLRRKISAAWSSVELVSVANFSVDA
jgi:hypothetical protein